MSSARTLIDMRLVSFEIEEGEDSFENCTGTRFTAVLEAEPFIFTEAVACFIDSPWDLDPNNGVCFDWRCVPCPSEPEPPAPDPNDPCVPQSPIAPAPLLLPDCWCEPLVTSRQCCQVPATLPQWTDAVLRLTINSGSAPLKNARIRVWPTVPTGINPSTPEGAEFFRCLEPCAIAEISQIPASSILIIDGVTRTTTLEQPGRAPFNADNLVFGPSRTLWAHPVLLCGGGYWVCMDVDIFNTAIDATLSLKIIGREIG